jgi:hypothetical protein
MFTMFKHISGNPLLESGPAARRMSRIDMGNLLVSVRNGTPLMWREQRLPAFKYFYQKYLCPTSNN